VPPDPAEAADAMLYTERDQLEDELDALLAAIFVVRGDLRRMQSDRDDLCADLAEASAEYAELQARADEMRGFEREYRGRLADWLEAGAALLKGDGRG
jgi:septal ring factor EnvC (AmiA/AmiB activator)